MKKEQKNPMINKRAVIIGGGASIREGDWSIPSNKLPVWSAIQNECTISINWGFKYFNPTLTVFGDYEFYIAEKEKLANLPLVFGMQDSYYGRSLKKVWTDIYHLENNIYLLPNGDGHTYHGINAWKNGFYTRFFSGILGINLAIALECTEIFMLGFDCNASEGRTHFYQDEFNALHKTEGGKEITGVGVDENGKYRTSLYNQDFNEKYLPLKEELKRIKTFNVSKNSGMTVFPKIGYSEFYDRLLSGELQQKPQEELRNRILEKYHESYDA